MKQFVWKPSKSEKFSQGQGILSFLKLWLTTILVFSLFAACSVNPSPSPVQPVEPTQEMPLQATNPGEMADIITPTSESYLPLSIEPGLDLQPEFRQETPRIATAPRYTLAVRIDYPNHAYTATSSVLFTNNEGVSLDRLYFHLYPNGGKSYGNGSLTVDSVRIGNNLEEASLLNPSLSQENTILEIPLPVSLAPGDQIQLEFDFHGNVPVESNQSTSSEQAGYGIFSVFDGVMTLTGWFPMLAVYDEEGWNLDPVFAFGDSVFSDAAIYDVSVTSSPGLILASSGLEIAKNETPTEIQWRLVSGPARDFALVMSPDFTIQTREVDGIQVNSYHRPGHSEGGEQALDIASDSLQLFSQLFGRYPFSELDVVEAPMNYALGVEFPGLFIINQDLYDTPESPNFVATATHETAHQWWYNLVGNDVIDEPWLDEGLATFSTGLYFENTQGSQAGQGYTEYLQNRYQENLAKGIDGPINETLPYYEQSGDPRLYSHSIYVKAGLMFSDLRQQIGDEAFFSALQSYFQQNIFEIGTADELWASFETASGQSLDSFIQEYTVLPEQKPVQQPLSTPETASISFAVIGDYGSGDKNAGAVADLVKSWKPNFIITVGDNNYPLGAADTIDQNVGQFYAEYIAPYIGNYGQGADQNAFFPTLGNHDWDSENAKPYLDYFTLPGNERYYDFRWGPVHFFAINGDWREPDGVGSSSAQAQWLKESLAASDAPWKVVYGHHPPYTSGYQGSVDWIRWPFKEWGADIYLAGHDHDYERLEVDGFPYIVNGLGGGAIYQFEEPLPYSLVRYNDGYGAILATANDNQITFQFITTSGEIIDTFTMQK
jgi:hypothetical protein